MHFKTPRLVRIESNYSDGISKKARYERKQALLRGSEHTARYGKVALDRGTLRDWMGAWSAQIAKPWGRYSAERFEREGWSYFASDVSLHPVLICDRYAYAAAPMYDKAAHPWAAKFMWFSLIDWLSEHDACDWLDLGGGSHGTWRDLNDRSYKNLYVQRRYRDPANRKPWRVQVCDCGWRQLVINQETCRNVSCR